MDKYVQYVCISAVKMQLNVQLGCYSADIPFGVKLITLSVVV